MISDQQITFVVQGPIREETRSCLGSIRSFFPGSVIILSTWKSECVDDLSYDECVFSTDPGSMDIMVDGLVVAKENTNRQIVSTLAGLQRVKSEYCVKLRSDNVITSRNMISLFEEASFLARDLTYSYLDKRVVVSSVNTIDPMSFIGYVFQVSDWFFFGKTEDIISIWERDIIKNDEYMLNQSLVESQRYRGGFNFGRFTAEQHITIGFAKKYMSIDCKYYRDHSSDNIEKTIALIVNNFYCVEPINIGIDFKKYSRFVKLNLTSYSDIKSYLGFWSTTVTKRLWLIYLRKMTSKDKGMSILIDICYLLMKRAIAFILMLKSYR